MSAPPALSVTTQSRPGLDVVTLRGSLDLDTASELRTAAVDAPLTGSVEAIDLTDVDFLDSVGVATLVAANRAAAGRGAELALVCSSPHLLKLLHISRLDTVVRVVASVDELTPSDGVA